MVILIILLIIIGLLFLLCCRGRTGHPRLEALRGWYYAHRGLHDDQKPENSMAAFRAALDAGFGIELDIHLLRDGNLAVFHDASLMRITGREGRIEDLTTDQLKDYHLLDTEETIPEFRQVLELYSGQAPMIIELKAENGNHAALAETACAMMEGYNGLWCMESFDPRCISWLKENRPDVIRGQLSANFFRDETKLNPFLKSILRHQLYNFRSQPDFTAYKFEDRKTISNFILRTLRGVQGVAWTIRTKEDFDTALQEGWIPIFENFDPRQ